MKILKRFKRRIDEFTNLHWNIFFLKGRFSFNKYKELRKDLVELKKQALESDKKFPVTKLYPCYGDKEDIAGCTKGAYFFQDLHIAQRIFINNPERHIDVGSRIDGFVAHVASFRKIEILDIRPMENYISNVLFTQTDIMRNDESLIEIADSISCLHALEHFGLGRYGDPICYEGYLKGFHNITRMLKKNGKFYFSVPLGKQRIEFHAHRVFSLKYLLDLLSPYYSIDAFSYVDDAGDFYSNVVIDSENLDSNFGCWYGCAIFELTKK